MRMILTGLAAALVCLGFFALPSLRRERLSDPVLQGLQRESREAIGQETAALAPLGGREGERREVAEQPVLDDRVVAPQLAIEHANAKKLVQHVSYMMAFAPATEESIRTSVLREYTKHRRREYLTDKDLASVNAICANFREQLTPISEEVGDLARSAFQEFYSSGKYPCTEMGPDALPKRSGEDSHWKLEGVLEFEGIYCDCSFRSEDFPRLNALLQVAADIRTERNRQINAIIRARKLALGR